MGRKMVYFATGLTEYGKYAKNDEDKIDLADLVDSDTLYDYLDKTAEGVDFVDSVESVDEFDAGYGWLRANPALKLSDEGDFFKISFPSAKAHKEWFRKPYETYMRELQAVLRGACLENFAKYELLSPDYLIKTAYSRQWSGYVAVVGPSGCIEELDYPMEFLRSIKPREQWLVSKKGWTYK